MKRLTSTLSYWSKSEYGDIFSTTRHYEKRVRKVEEESSIIILKRTELRFITLMQNI